jgi:imidazolonepropionase-like amidohydrolase
MNVTVAAHATSDAAVYRAAQAGVNTVDHAYQVADSTLAFMAARGIGLVPTDGDSLGRIRRGTAANQVTQSLQWQRDRVQRAIKAGVPIVAGSDMYLDPDGVTQGEGARGVLRGYFEGGMSMTQVLQSATSTAARFLGMRGRGLGAIRQGYYADMIAVEGDATTDIDVLERVRWVMKDGIVYKK